MTTGVGADMTRALREAFEEAEKLPEAEQDQLAAAIRDEIRAERRWESALAASQGALARLADEALAEHRTGRTLPLDPDEE
jgi:hypothetical protein